MIAVGRDEDLGLVHEAAKGLGVDDTVPVSLELVANPVGGLGSHASGATLAGPGCGIRPTVAGFRGFHAGRLASVMRAPGMMFPGACARTWERTARRTPSPVSPSAGASRIGCSISALSRSSV